MKDKVISCFVILFAIVVVFGFIRYLNGGKYESKLDDLTELCCTVHKYSGTSSIKINCSNGATIDIALDGDGLDYVRYQIVDEEGNDIDYLKDTYMRINMSDGSRCVYGYNDTYQDKTGDCAFLFGTNSIESDIKSDLRSFLADLDLDDDDDIIDFSKWVLENNEIDTITNTVEIDHSESNVVNDEKDTSSEVSVIGNSNNSEISSGGSSSSDSEIEQSNHNYSYDLNDAPSKYSLSTVDLNSGVNLRFLPLTKIFSPWILYLSINKLILFRLM